MKLNLNYLSKELKLNTSKVEMNSYSSTSFGGCDHTNTNALDLIKTSQLSVINLAKKKNSTSLGTFGITKSYGK